MRIPNQTPNVETNVKRQKKFTIKTTEKTFKILSNSLYSNKERAIIRELACNAYDAHVAAGKKDIPFIVHLPSKVNPVFYVEDMGTGLTPKEIETLYSTYFESTKEDDNNYIGCLGLGSKSPFAYTDAFTITSWKDGKQHVYSCFINSDGEPTVAHIITKNSNRENGLKVEIAVLQDDINTFVNEAENIFVYFKIKPKIIGQIRNFHIPENFYIRNNGWWKIPKKTSFFHYKNPYPKAIMGNVSYPIRKNELINDLTEIEKSILDLEIEIDFKLGELDITPSREELSYTKETISNIKAKLALIEKQIREEIKEEFNNCDSLWAARVKTREAFYNQNHKLHYFSNLLKNDIIKWNNEPLSTIINIKSFLSSERKDGLEITKYIKKYSHLRNFKIKKTTTAKIHFIEAFSDKKFIFIKDSNRTYESKVREYLSKNDNIDKVVTVKYTNPWLANEFVEKLGLSEKEVNFAEDMFPKKKKNYKTKILIYTGNISPCAKGHEYWNEIEDNISNLSGYYVKVNSFKVTDGLSITDVIKLKNSLQKCGYNIKTIYGIRSKLIKKAEKNPNLIYLLDFAKKVVAQIKEKEWFKYLNEDWYYSISCNIKGFISNNEFPSHTVAAKFKKTLEKVSKAIREMDKYLELYKLVNNSQLESHNSSSNLEKIKEKFYETYPLLPYINFSYNYNNANKEALKYIKLINK